MTRKILHALVGYLTVTALHFHPFAFASPLAATSIDYDGYVNTTQNHKDSALMKRVPGDIIEARQWETPAVIAVAVLIADVFLGIIWIQGDDPVRGNDMEFLVKHFD